jgi:ribosomal protein S18 acetylase RimI-like enzyme
VIRRLTEADASDADRVVQAVLGSRHQVRGEEVVDVLACPGLGMFAGGSLIGLVTHAVQDSDAEIVALGVVEGYRGHGCASALVAAAVAEFVHAGVQRVCVVTTNDNLRALATYQRQGFRLVELRPGAVDRARSLKPSIPLIGEHGIAIHDELVLQRLLR